LFGERKMTCGCKKKNKRGSGKATFLSGATFRGYPKGSGMRVSGGAIYKKRRKKRKKGGMTMTGGGINLSGGGMPFNVSSALRWVANKRLNGRRVA
jgi:hypothetical protein